MTNKIFKSIFLTSFFATIIVSILIMFMIFSSYERVLTKELGSEAEYILHAIEREESDTVYFEQFSSDNRVTLISSDGNVLYDSKTDATSMENHSDRPEFAEALSSGVGMSERYSSTLSETTFYYAVKTQRGNVLRISNTRSSIMGIIAKMIPLLLLIVAFVGLFSFLIARGMSKNLVLPINSLDLNRPLDNDTYDELSPLLLRMDRQRRELDMRMRELLDKQNELTVITENMNEGLILIGKQGDILSMNRSAETIFKVVDKKEGHSFLTVNRSPEVREVVNKAVNGMPAESIYENGGNQYRLIGSPVLQNDEPMGVVLIIIDITAQYTAEISRRDFTSNVSHELKTPLTSISGYAEIMRDGVAKPEDMKKFASRIFDEANYLISLVNNILELSKLDERRELGEKTTINLLSAATTAVERVSVLASKKNVNVEVTGEEVTIEGYLTIIEEILRNLIENAIKYNVENGEVKVSVGENGDKKFVSVADTGIGIAKEHQKRIFERFYQVDKSHSRESSGTGLGLSIVKHGVEIHGADLKIESSEGRGTIITISF